MIVIDKKIETTFGYIPFVVVTPELLDGEILIIENNEIIGKIINVGI